MSTRSSRELAVKLGLPAPTSEQAAIIEFPQDVPALVVAGAGSGKTATMAQRVVWLVANKKARPSQILGLTFTRKATTELSQRINANLAALSDLDRDDVERSVDDTLFESPTISTYNAFANRLFQENALRVGYEPESTLLTEAGAWQIAYDTVTGCTDERIVTLDKGPAAVTGMVLDLAHAISDHLVDIDRLEQFPAEFSALLDLPGKGLRKPVRAAIETVSAIPILLPLVRAFAETKRQRALIEYSDQVPLALAALIKSPSVVSEYRNQYRYVLLDEYQDTSVSQTKLLAHLFHDTPAMAVGDPNQSIYGWRGAASGNLSRFVEDFSSSSRAPKDASLQIPFTLSTSWRNDNRILDVAKAVAKPLNLAAAKRAGSDSMLMELAPRRDAGPGRFEYVEAVTLDDEAEAVAGLIEEEISASATPQEIALLFRTRKHMGVFAESLRKRGIPHEVVGLGGVLESPEVTDLRCALAVIAEATAGNELIRLLTGSRWRLGLRDIAALHQHARALAHRDGAAQDKVQRDGAPEDGFAHSRTTQNGDPLDQETGFPHRDEASAVPPPVSRDDEVTIVDALDHIGTLAADSHQLDSFSESGRVRLRDAAHTFAKLRRASGRPLRDLARLVEYELALDIEVIANPRNQIPRRNLDIFLEKVAEYEATVAGASLSGLVSWLARVAADENIAPEQVQSTPGTVQLLTVHAAKGLEFDVVVLPRFVKDEYPARNKGGYGWLHPGHLPNEFRGDQRDIPQLSWRASTDTADLGKRYDEYIEAEKSHYLAEERRILYVAVTRPRRRLILSAGLIGTNRKNPYERSAYFDGLSDLITEPWEPVSEEMLVAAAQTQTPTSVPWPRDPLGERRFALAAAATLVEEAANDTQSLASAGAFAPDIELLVAEYRAKRDAKPDLAAPDTIAASHLADYLADAEAMMLDALRPIPHKPSTAAALGTAFHAWVETRYSAYGYQDTLDLEPLANDSEQNDNALYSLDDARLTPLIETFLASQWAAMRPVDVEVAITTTLGGRQIPCKIDAVFARPDGGYEIVDWKTGALPRDEEERASKAVQLALYRHAYAEWKGIDANSISAAFFFVAHNEVVRPVNMLDSQQLAARIAALDEIARADAPCNPLAVESEHAG